MKNIMELYSQNESELQRFLKMDKIDFEEQTDILKLADILATL